jgi:hypothetical protein
MQVRYGATAAPPLRAVTPDARQPDLHHIISACQIKQLAIVDVRKSEPPLPNPSASDRLEIYSEHEEVSGRLPDLGNDTGNYTNRDGHAVHRSSRQNIGARREVVCRASVSTPLRRFARDEAICPGCSRGPALASFSPRASSRARRVSSPPPAAPQPAASSSQAGRSGCHPARLMRVRGARIARLATLAAARICAPLHYDVSMMHASTLRRAEQPRAVTCCVERRLTRPQTPRWIGLAQAATPWC